MALATIHRSSVRVIGSKTQFCCRYMSVAAKPSHIIIPTAISSIRQYNSAQTPSNSYSATYVKALRSQIELLGKDKVHNETHVKALESQVELLRKSLEELLRRQKDPLLAEIELEMSKIELTQDKKLPSNFEIHESYWPWAYPVTLKRSTHVQKESICLGISKPVSCSQVPLCITVGSSENMMNFKLKFLCTIMADGYKISRITTGRICKQVPFDLLSEDAQHLFYRYLQLRGVDSRTTNSIYDYMLQKLKREHVGDFYKRFKNIVKASQAGVVSGVTV
ncbi:hypothetical protein POM88_003322 [Heracleum sosnowskyi]|uniref:Uncharacterized protein n=1 Tax=Heracleum sosnowskyi TaxID=360622 RepID=A0AAD8JG46_9APIA|nr:hypothetical protein POM88_003322 [Heracleum sosnowskyi]